MDAKCQCSKHSRACAGRITQEDLLCDVCRPGGCWLITFGSVGSSPDDHEAAMHIERADIVFDSFAGVATNVKPISVKF